VFALTSHQPIARKRDELFRFAMQVEYMFWSTTIATVIQLGMVMSRSLLNAERAAALG
jgi:hypothetical protein